MVLTLDVKDIRLFFEKEKIRFVTDVDRNASARTDYSTRARLFSDLRSNITVLYVQEVVTRFI